MAELALPVNPCPMRKGGWTWAGVSHGATSRFSACRMCWWQTVQSAELRSYSPFWTVQSLSWIFVPRALSCRSSVLGFSSGWVWSVGPGWDPLRFHNFAYELYFRHKCQLLWGIFSVNKMKPKDHVLRLIDKALCRKRIQGFCWVYFVTVTQE